jgi:hypothetical protein
MLSFNYTHGTIASSGLHFHEKQLEKALIQIGLASPQVSPKA